MSDRQGHLRTYKRRAPAIELIPQAEMVRRIEAARVEEAPPLCPTCWSTTPASRTEKWCPAGNHTVPLDQFYRHRSRPDGRAWACKACTAPRLRELKIKRQIRAALGRAS